jgi:hypothetical protein
VIYSPNDSTGIVSFKNIIIDNPKFDSVVTSYIKLTPKYKRVFFLSFGDYDEDYYEFYIGYTNNYNPFPNYYPVAELNYKNEIFLVYSSISFLGKTKDKFEYEKYLKKYSNEDSLHTRCEIPPWKVTIAKDKITIVPAKRFPGKKEIKLKEIIRETPSANDEK